jgi:hypothetical protein
MVVDKETIDTILLIAKVGGSVILAWMTAMVILVLHKTRRAKTNGKR